MYNAILRWKSISVSKKLYKLYKHDHLEGLYPLQSKICRSPNQTVQWELPWCSDISSQFITYVIKYVQCVFSVSIGPRPELAKSPMDLDCEPGTCTDSTDTDCTCKFWCRLWTMWTMWTWVNSDVYGLFNWCLWPLWRNMPVRSSKMHNFDRPQWAMSCHVLPTDFSIWEDSRTEAANELPARSTKIWWSPLTWHQDAPRCTKKRVPFYRLLP